MHHNVLRLTVFTLMGIAWFSSMGLGQGEKRPVAMHVTIAVHEDESVAGTLIVEVIAKNTGVKPVYVMTRPVRSNGKPGPYISIDPAMSTRLIIAERFFSLPPYEMFKNDASVHLELVTPGASHTDRMALAFPLRMTEPQYSGNTDTQVVELESIRSVQAQVGVLDSSESLMALIRRKGADDLFNGLETTENAPVGRTLNSEQFLETSVPTEIRLSPHP